MPLPLIVLMFAGLVTAVNLAGKEDKPIMLKAGQTYHQTEDGTITIGTHNLPVPVEPDVPLPPPLKMTESYGGILLRVEPELELPAYPEAR